MKLMEGVVEDFISKRNKRELKRNFREIRRVIKA